MTSLARLVHKSNRNQLRQDRGDLVTIDTALGMGCRGNDGRHHSTVEVVSERNTLRDTVGEVGKGAGALIQGAVVG